MARNLKSREGLPRLLNLIDAKVGVEVGVYEGKFSKALLHHTDIETLYSIDPWVDANGDFDDEIYERAKDSVDRFGDRAILRIDSSPDAADQFEDASLDFVFIDGDHSYDATYTDIKAWLPKIKPGGILSGHDYSNTGNAICRRFVKEEGQQQRRMVKKAVKTFIAESEKEYTLNLIAEHSIVWWFFV